MANLREAGARSAAKALLKEVGAQTLPVQPFEIANIKKILVVERELPEDIYGAFGFSNGGFAIAVSTRCPTPGHRRFTAAHELGHYHLPGHVDRMFGGRDGWVESKGAHFHAGADPIEREADYFASELLMPDLIVRPFLKGRSLLAQVKRVAERCETSLSSAAITVARLTGERIAVLVSVGAVLEWPAFSEALRSYAWARTPMKGDWAPPRSATKRLAQDAVAVRRAEATEGEGLLCEWFPGAPDYVHVEEEAIGLGAYGRVLTFLRPVRLPDVDEEQERSWRRMREDRDNPDGW
jgi:Zn-dependent peptidase ImmA (M78 family)